MMDPTERSPNGNVSDFEQGVRPFSMRPLAVIAATAAAVQNNGMMLPPSGAQPHSEQGMGPSATRPPTPAQNTGVLRPPSDERPHFKQGMGSLAIRTPPPAQGDWPSFPSSQMTNHGIVNNNPRSLDLGTFPPWQLTVTLPSGENRHIDIPYSEGAHVIGLPLGLDVPELIASNYKGLLCMVDGMTCIISNLTRNLDLLQEDAARYLEDRNSYRLELEKLKGSMTNLTRNLDLLQEDAARYLEDRNRYRLELEKLKCSIGGDMAVSQDVMASVSPSKKRKTSTEEYGPCVTKPVCITKAVHLPPPRSDERPDIPVLLVQECATEEDMDVSDDSPLTSVKCSLGEKVPTGASLYSSDVQTEKVDSVAGVGLVGKPVDATNTSISTICLSVDSTTTLTIPKPKDINPPLVESAIVSRQGGDYGFEYVENFKIPKEYAVLYKKIFNKHGHMATKKVVKSDAILLTCVTSLLKIASIMENVRGVDLSEALLESWEGDIKDAETLQFNIKWLREKLNRLKISLKLSFRIDKEVESREQVLDATQVQYAGLHSRKDELDTELSELKTNIRKFEAKIFSEREVIGKKIAQKSAFLYQPVLGDMFI